MVHTTSYAVYEVFVTESIAPLEAPEGTRDLLFDGAKQLRRAESAVARVFDAAGFDEVIPPTIEHAELFSDVAALHTSDATGKLLAVRADFTWQMARIATTRLSGQSPLKLWYRGPVVRDMPSGRMAPRERFQAGLELMGDGSAEADARILALVGAALDALGLGEDDVRISVGSTAYFAALLDACNASPTLRAQLRDAIDRKDHAGVESLASTLDPAARDAVVFLAGPESQVDVLERAGQLAPNASAQDAIERLRTVVELARPELGKRLEIDLGEVRGLGYYTGLVFNAYAAGAPGAVGGGGRYDSLLTRFGDSRAAVGFSLDLDTLAPLARFPEGA